jgi:hypothetical protein
MVRSISQPRHKLYSESQSLYDDSARISKIVDSARGKPRFLLGSSSMVNFDSPIRMVGRKHSKLKTIN